MHRTPHSEITVALTLFKPKPTLENNTYRSGEKGSASREVLRMKLSFSCYTLYRIWESKKCELESSSGRFQRLNVRRFPNRASFSIFTFHNEVPKVSFNSDGIKTGKLDGNFEVDRREILFAKAFIC